MAAGPGATLELDADGDITLEGSLVEGLAAIKQHVRVRCLAVKDEWFLDPDDGVPYFSSVFVKNPDTSALAAVFRERIEGTPGVRLVTQISVTFNKQTRSGALAFRANTDVGELTDAFTVGGKTE